MHRIHGLAHTGQHLSYPCAHHLVRCSHEAIGTYVGVSALTHRRAPNVVKHGGDSPHDEPGDLRCFIFLLRCFVLVRAELYVGTSEQKHCLAHVSGVLLEKKLSGS